MHMCKSAYMKYETNAWASFSMKQMEEWEMGAEVGACDDLCYGFGSYIMFWIFLILCIKIV